MKTKATQEIKDKIVQLYRDKTGPSQISRIIEAEFGVDLTTSHIGMILYHARLEDPTIPYYQKQQGQPVQVTLMLTPDVIEYYKERTDHPLTKMASLLSLVANEDLYVAVLDEKPCKKHST